jgi:hypothetical protein
LCTKFNNFELASARDALFNAAGVPLRLDPTGAAGRQVGQELDIILNFHLATHSDLMVGYSKLFAGDFIKNTAANADQAQDPEFLFFMYTYRW